MQAGEKVHVIAGTNPKWKCPFAHEPEQKDFTNDFAGSGKTLGGNLETGKPTSTNPPEFSGSPTLPVEKDPRHRPGHALNRALDPRPIKMTWNSRPLNWGVTCAAHHLLPSADGFKRSAIVPWLVKKGQTAQVGTKGRKLASFTGKVDNHVGYDLNGAQNGVWLPGPYYMYGVWTNFTSGLDPEDEVPPTGAPSGGEMMPEDYSSQLEYAVVAMRKANAQFHDSHRRPYSAFVVRVLNAIANKMQKIVDTAECPDCRAKIQNSGPPAPYSLILRLNASGGRLRNLLEGGPTGWKPNIITSKWALEYMKKPTYEPPNN
jgi:hypothetical protein